LALRLANTASTGRKASNRQSGFSRSKYLIPFIWLVLGFSPVTQTVRPPLSKGDTSMFKVTKFIFENDPKSKCRVRKYITVKSGLSWQEAKAMRNQDRALQIVKVV
jgi:hypothetical protein